MNKLHKVSDILFSDNQMTIKIDGKKYTFNLKNLSLRLWRASAAQRKAFEISPSGYGIHWSLIDEDLSIPGLLSSASPAAFETLHH
ncbi:MAG: DUF2442 domain-containing protein [Candidatus Omnitrophica bacterium]|nr:DUF2442 domain-containing protein [Candidatus Omnitrophota bacterium]